MPLLGGTTGLFRAAGGLLAGCVEGCCAAVTPDLRACCSVPFGNDVKLSRWIITISGVVDCCSFTSFPAGTPGTVGSGAKHPGLAALCNRTVEVRSDWDNAFNNTASICAWQSLGLGDYPPNSSFARDRVEATLGTFVSGFGAPYTCSNTIINSTPLIYSGRLFVRVGLTTAAFVPKSIFVDVGLWRGVGGIPSHPTGSSEALIFYTATSPLIADVCRKTSTFSGQLCRNIHFSSDYVLGGTVTATNLDPL